MSDVYFFCAVGRGWRRISVLSQMIIFKNYFKDIKVLCQLFCMQRESSDKRLKKKPLQFSLLTAIFVFFGQKMIEYLYQFSGLKNKTELDDVIYFQTQNFESFTLFWVLFFENEYIVLFLDFGPDFSCVIYVFSSRFSSCICCSMTAPYHIAFLCYHIPHEISHNCCNTPAAHDFHVCVYLIHK